MPRDIPHVVVEPHRRGAASLRLGKVTYFYRTAVYVRAVAELVVRDKPPLRCPPALWSELQKLALEGVREKLASGDLTEAWLDD